MRSRTTSARNPASLRRPSRCRTSAIASSSASLQAGAGPGRDAIAMAPEPIASSTSTYAWTNRSVGGLCGQRSWTTACLPQRPPHHQADTPGSTHITRLSLLFNLPALGWFRLRLLVWRLCRRRGGWRDGGFSSPGGGPGRVWTAPGILEAVKPGRMQGHGGTAEVSGGAA